jgi:hypothetical protein
MSGIILTVLVVSLLVLGIMISSGVASPCGPSTFSSGTDAPARTALPSPAPIYRRFHAAFLSRFAAFSVAVLAVVLRSKADILTSAGAVKALPNTEASKHLPVHLRGVLTYVHPPTYALFLQDATAGVYISCDPDEVSRLGLRPGRIIEADGVTEAGNFAPIVQLTAESGHGGVKVVGEGDFPSPVPVSPEMTAFSEVENAFSRIRGVVQSVARETNSGMPGDDRVRLSVDVGRGVFRVYVPGFRKESPLPDWVDASVRIDGVHSPVANSAGQLVRFDILCPNAQSVVVEKPAPKDAFAGPVESPESLMRFESGRTPRHRVRLSGTVTLSRGSRGFYFASGTAGIWVELADGTAPAEGDSVDVAGFPTRGLFYPKITEAVVRSRGHGTPPGPGRPGRDRPYVGRQRRPAGLGHRRASCKERRGRRVRAQHLLRRQAFRRDSPRPQGGPAF